MKNIVQGIAAISTGSIFLLSAAICPLPALLAVPGVAWRIILATSGALLLAWGIRIAKEHCTKEDGSI